MYLSTKARESYGDLQEAIIGVLDGYLFSWDKIPKNDNERLIDFLIQNFDIDWVKTAKIMKIEDNKIIKVANKKNLLFLRLNDEKTKVTLEIVDVGTEELNAKIENCKLNIYLKEKRNGNIIDYDYDKIRDKCSALRTELTKDLLSRRAAPLRPNV